MDTHAAPGDVLLGKYRVERVLGQGGMGIVVAARHVELGQLHAIKFLLPSMLEHEEVLERFLREARAAAKLQSDHVVRVSDVGRMDSGAPYMVMEYLEGCDLKALVSREGPLPIEDVVTYVLQVGDAISEAHGVGIIHRDLKPANLFLVRRRGRVPCVKVLDFGISKHTGPEEVDLTTTNMSLGSPLYMSPEQMSKSKTVDGRADIWAIGVILYELLTGVSPFRASSLLEVASNVLQEEPKPIRELRLDVPEGLVAVVERCLRKRREDRFANVDELMQAMQGFVSRDVIARLPMASLTNEKSSSTEHAQAEHEQIDAQTLRIDKNAPSSGPSAAEPTSLTFGQTGKPKVVRSHGSFAALAFVGGAVIVGIGLWFGWRASTTQEAAPIASIVSADASPANDSTSAAATTTPSTRVVPDAPLATQVPPVYEDEAIRTPKAKPTTTTPERRVVVPEKPEPTTVKIVTAPPSTTAPTSIPAPAPTPTSTRPPDPF